MNKEDLYLILTDASSYESGNVAHLVTVTDRLEFYILDKARQLINCDQSYYLWNYLNEFREQLVIPISKTINKDNIYDLLGAAPNLVTYCKDKGFSDLIDELLSKGSDGIMLPSRKELKNKIINGFKEIVEEYGE